MSINSIPLTPLAAMSFSSQMLWLAAALLGVAIAIPLIAIGWILWHEVKHAEADRKLLYPESPESEEGEAGGKRSGQFGIYDLLVLTTVAAVACAIVRLQIHVVLKMFALVAVWLGFTCWACGKPNARNARSLAFKRRLAVMHAVGSMLAFSPFLWLHFIQRPARNVYVEVGFVLLLMLTGPIPAIWRAASAVRAELAAGRRKKAVAS